MIIKFTCDDGFMVVGEEDEVKLAAYMHMAMKHPDIKINMREMEKHVEEDIDEGIYEDLN